MGHTEAVHSRSYRTLTLGMRTRDFAAETGTIPVALKLLPSYRFHRAN